MVCVRITLLNGDSRGGCAIFPLIYRYNLISDKYSANKLNDLLPGISLVLPCLLGLKKF